MVHTDTADTMMLQVWCPRPDGMILQDKINAFWEISKKELEDTRAQLRNKDREMEELEERHEVEIKVCLRAYPICLLASDASCTVFTQVHD